MHKYANEITTAHGTYYATEIVVLVVLIALVVGYLVGRKTRI